MPTFAGAMPPWLEHAIETGQTTIGGKTYPTILPTRAISPVSTPEELIQTAISRPGAQTFAEMLNPAVQAAIHIAGRQSPYGADVGSYRQAIGQEASRLAPSADLIHDLISPPAEGGLY